MSAEQKQTSPKIVYGSWRCGHCYRVNDGGAEQCSKCQQPKHQDPEPGYRTAVKVIYSFQGVLLLLGILAVIGLKPGVFYSVFILLIVWWAGLILFYGHNAIGGYRYKFELERRAATAFIAIQESVIGRALVVCTYRVLYWPIFVPDKIYLWGAIILAAAYLYATIFL